MEYQKIRVRGELSLKYLLVLKEKRRAMTIHTSTVGGGTTPRTRIIQPSGIRACPEETLRRKMRMLLAAPDKYFFNKDSNIFY